MYNLEDVFLGDPPRVYIAKPEEIAEHMKTQCHGRGHGSLHEDYRNIRPRSQYDHKIPHGWKFSQEKIDLIQNQNV